MSFLVRQQMPKYHRIKLTDLKIKTGATSSPQNGNTPN